MSIMSSLLPFWAKKYWNPWAIQLPAAPAVWNAGDPGKASRCIYRYGGEEFLGALPDAGLHQAEKVMEGIRIRSSEQPISEDDASITQTVSIGLTEVNLDEGIDIAIERADEALYQAKQSGRNRLISSPTTDHA